MKEKEQKTLIAVLASHDSTAKNNEMAHVIEELHKNHRKVLREFHFVFTGGTFQRLVEGKDTQSPARTELRPLSKKAGLFLKNECGVTILPDRKEGGVTTLANLVVQRQCSIVWPFLSSYTTHWLNPENLALMRLCDKWNVTRLMNGVSVRDWFATGEALRDTERHCQQIPLKMTLGTPETDGRWPTAKKMEKRCYELSLPDRGPRENEFWKALGKQTLAMIAHDDMKGRMVDFAIQYENELVGFDRILATGTTGQAVENACRRLREQKKIRRCLSGPHGGDIEIATEILFNRCHVVIFFIDPLNPHPHIDDIRVVFSACMAEIANNDVRMMTNEVHAREWMEEAVRRHH
jgi:methylglyoxal synthase